MEYLRGLYNAEPVYFLVAGISTTIYLLKLLLFSISGLSKDIDLTCGHLDDTHHLAAESSFKLFTTQSLLVFLIGMSWLGLAARTELKLPHSIAAIVALAFGFAMMILTAFLAKFVGKLSNIPAFERESVVGTRGRVYLTVPPQGKGEGEVELVFGGGKKILKALNQGITEIPSFSEVIVTGVEGKHFIVKRIAER